MKGDRLTAQWAPRSDMRSSLGPEVYGGELVPVIGDRASVVEWRFLVEGGRLRPEYGAAFAQRGMVLHGVGWSERVSTPGYATGNLDRVHHAEAFHLTATLSEATTRVRRDLGVRPMAMRLELGAGIGIERSTVFDVSGLEAHGRGGRAVMRHSRDQVPIVRYTVTINEQPHVIEIDEKAYIESLARKRRTQNAHLPQTILMDGEQVPNPGLFQTEDDFLTYLVSTWAQTVPGFTDADLQAAAMRIMARFAGRTEV